LTISLFLDDWLQPVNAMTAATIVNDNNWKVLI